MKRQFWTGGVLLIMILWGLTGCGGPKAPMPGGDASEPPDRMADGPGMVYTSRALGGMRTAPWCWRSRGRVPASGPA